MNNVKKIQNALKERRLDGVLITDEKDQRYALGFPFTDGAVLVSREEAWLITDSRYVEAAAAAVGGWAEVVLFDGKKGLSECVRGLVQKAGINRLGVEEEKLSHAEFLRWQQCLARELVSAQSLFQALRAVKSQEEIECMRHAQQISERALMETMHLIKPGISERELAAELVYRMLKFGGEGCSFDPIVVAGAKTSMPHGVPGDELLENGSFVTIDFGCLKEGYCSDMTRTFALGKPTEEMVNIYETVLKAQTTAIKAARAGITGQELDKAARDVIAAAGHGAHFGHGFGHSLGLDIHESPNANPRNDKPLPAGAVVSAEPGIYLPGRFGVRIEDVVVLREGGCENLTTFPKELIVL